jgi:hypothetical protein
MSSNLRNVDLPQKITPEPRRDFSSKRCSSHGWYVRGSPFLGAPSPTRQRNVKLLDTMGVNQLTQRLGKQNKVIGWENQKKKRSNISEKLGANIRKIRT